MNKWYIVTVRFGPNVKDVALRMSLKQELVAAFNVSMTYAVNEVKNILRKEQPLKGRNFNEYDITIEDDLDQTSRQ